MTGDSLQHFIFENAPIRGEIVHLDATWQAVLDRRKYPPAVRTILGELMAAAALLTSSIKFEGKLIMQVQGKGPVSLLVVECTSDRAMRALAQWEGKVPAAALSELVGDGRLVITIDPQNGADRYQTTVSLEGLTVAEALENYFARSEQIATRLWLAADPQQAAGMLLQRMPDVPGMDEDSWARAIHLSATITHSELLGLPVSEIIHRLYHEEDIRLFARMPISFRCSCSRKRVASVLLMLSYDDIHLILAEHGSVKVDCEFCGQHYEFDPVDAEQLFASALDPDTSLARH